MSDKRDGLDRRSVLTTGIPLVAGLAAGAAGAATLTVAATPAVAQASGSKLEEVLSRGRLIAGVTLTIPPWGYRNEQGEPSGFDIDMARIIAKGLFDDPTKVEFFEQEMDARLPNLAAGKIDVAVQLITVTAQRAQTAEFTIPYYRESITTMHLADSPHTGAASMAGKGTTTSILQNTFAEDLVKMGIEDATVEQFDTVSSSILALDGGRVDAYVGGHGEISYFVGQRPERYRIGDTSWLPQTYAAAVRPGDQRWLNFVNTALHEAMTGVEFPAYAAAFKANFGVDLPQPQSGMPREFM